MSTAPSRGPVRRHLFRRRMRPIVGSFSECPTRRPGAKHIERTAENAQREPPKQHNPNQGRSPFARSMMLATAWWLIPATSAIGAQ
jgi:hypothetical protein